MTLQVDIAHDTQHATCIVVITDSLSMMLYGVVAEPQLHSFLSLELVDKMQDDALSPLALR